MPIAYNEEKQLFKLDAGETTLAFSVTNGVLMNRFWGVRLDRMEDVPDEQFVIERRRGGRYSYAPMYSEYPGWNSALFGCEPALKVTFADGTRDVQLTYSGYTLDENSLRIRLEDKTYRLQAELKYDVYDDSGVISRSVRLYNGGDAHAVLETFCSGTLHLPPRDSYRLTSLTGKWSEEYRLTRERLRDGQTLLQTRNILSGANAVPFFALDEGDADERRGGVWFGTLVWSGTHKITAERGINGEVSVTAGINDFDCRITLKPGDAFETPPLVFGYTEKGFGGMSRHIHSFERHHVMTRTEAERIMPVVYNAYGAFFSKIDEQKILSLIPHAADMGIEALIIDAGWHGEGDLIHKALGDWTLNRQRFPHGLKPISDELHKRGMLFGLWMEPECVHPDSHLYAEHPDWVFGYPARAGDLENARYVLNFALDEVCDYITEKIISLIEDFGVDYFKIDFNRFLYAVGTDRFAPEEQRSMWWRYVENLSRCYMTIKSRYPKLLFENCAGGGMRTDLAMLRFAGRINRSDNQDPLDILKLHEGFSCFMLPKLAGGGCHISDVYTRYHNGRITPMKYQAEISMMGSMAIGKNLLTMNDDEKAELKGYIERYKSLRHIVHLGDVYRLASAYDKPYAAFEYLYKDEGVLFMLGQSQQFMVLPEPLRLDGLEENALYEVEGYGLKSGRALMKIGLKIPLEGDFDSRVIRFRKV